MAGKPGLEPRLTESESAVLPIKLFPNGSGTRTRTQTVGSKDRRSTIKLTPNKLVDEGESNPYNLGCILALARNLVGDPGNDPGQHIGLGFTDPLASLAK